MRYWRAGSTLQRATLLVLLLAQWAIPLGVLAASPPREGYEQSGTLRPEYQLDEWRALVGRSFWVRKPEPGQSPRALFCDSKVAPAGGTSASPCPTEKYGLAHAEPFTIEELIAGQPDPAHSWLKIKFSSGKTAYLSTEDFKRNRYLESRVSTALYGIDYAIVNSGDIFDDYPPKILDQRRAQFQAGNDAKLAQEKLDSERMLRLQLLYLGMTTQQVRNSSWGPPDTITPTSLGRLRLEKWDYGGGTVLFFEDDRLRRIQSGSRR